MSKQYVKKQALEKTKNISKTREKPNANLFSWQKKKIYPVGLHKTCSILSLSSLSSSLSQDSIDSSSSTTDSCSPVDQNIAFALHLIRNQVPEEKIAHLPAGDKGTTRCKWITQNSDSIYVKFHDQCWGVPVYDDNQLFEMLAMCGMLMDFNWTEILKRRQLLREAFAGFDPNKVSKMGDEAILDVASNKELALPESRVRCIVDNAKCITKVADEFGSFGVFMWDHMSYKPMINKFRQPKNVPLRSPKAEIISKDLVRRGFRFVGPVIVYSFMQAAGMTIDHLVDCFRYNECVNLAERPWRHV